MIKLLVLIALLFVLFNKSSASAPYQDPPDVQTSQNLVASLHTFLSRQLKFNTKLADKFQYKIEMASQRYAINIQNGRKKIKMILANLPDLVNEYKVMFMEEIAQFGNSKKFLNIKTSKGSKEEAVRAFNQGESIKHEEKLMKQTQSVQKIQKIKSSDFKLSEIIGQQDLQFNDAKKLIQQTLSLGQQ